MRKDLKRRIGKLEKEMRADLQKTIFVIRFVNKETKDEEPTAYAADVHGPRVTQRPGEGHEAFYERAKKELLGESANKPGFYTLFAW